MSLINDALKQLKQARQDNPPPSPPPLPPVESNPKEGAGWVVLVIIVLLVAATGIFVGLSLSKPVPLAASAMPTTTVPSVSASAPRPALPLVVPMIATHQVESAAVTPLTATNLASNLNSVAVVPLKPLEPKLQGILFAPARPCAIVNGRTVFVGDRINEFRVAAISKDLVTLQSRMGTKVLSLNPQ